MSATDDSFLLSALPTYSCSLKGDFPIQSIARMELFRNMHAEENNDYRKDKMKMMMEKLQQKSFFTPTVNGVFQTDYKC